MVKIHSCEIYSEQQLKNKLKHVKNAKYWGFPSGAVVKNPLANAGDTGLSPGPGRSHMLWSS